MAHPKEDVYCTLLMSDSYLPGAAVLANSLRDAATTKKLAVLVVKETLSPATLAELGTLYDYVLPVDCIRNPNPANLYLMGRPDLSFTFTKIALWRQTQFRKIVYLDADVVALRAMDELFDIDAPFAAAPDIGWPDAFNSGVMVITPDMGEFWALQTMAATGDSFDGADQGLLNQYFEHRSWQRLNFTYNCTPNAEYQWEPAYRYYKRDISAVHFIGKNKPWSCQHPVGNGVYGELLARWWAVHNRHLSRSSAVTSSKLDEIETTITDTPIISGATQPEVSADITDSLLTEPGEPTWDAGQDVTKPRERADNIGQGVINRAPTPKQHQFTAPEMEWDATKSEPPAKSKPEASNFPSETYTFSENRALFKPPVAYPEPPSDMWYKVPETKPRPLEQPKPIFPWETQSDRPKTSRVFAEDASSEPSAIMDLPPHGISAAHYENDDVASAKPAADRSVGTEDSSSAKSADEHWQAFELRHANAWDSIPGIENYVRFMVDAQGQRGKSGLPIQTLGTEDLNPTRLERTRRRESLILTDFPSATERPSLPVTPAPLRHPSFWGDECNSQGELLSATGVPEQQEWNSLEKLDQLRRSSLVEFEHLTRDKHPSPPLRALPPHSIPDGDTPSKAASEIDEHISSQLVSADDEAIGVTVPDGLSGTLGIAEKDFGGETMVHSLVHQQNLFRQPTETSDDKPATSVHGSKQELSSLLPSRVGSGSSGGFIEQPTQSTPSSSQHDSLGTGNPIDEATTDLNMPERDDSGDSPSHV